MNSRNFNNCNSMRIKKWHAPVNHNSFPKKSRNESCYKNLGEFVFDAQCSDSYTYDHNVEKDVPFSPCQIIEQDCIDVYPSCEGRLLVLHVNLKNICPNKIIIVGVLIYENDRLYAFKVKKIPTEHSRCCSFRNFDAGEFCFIIEEEQLCEHRKFKAKVISHYVKF